MTAVPRPARARDPDPVVIEDPRAIRALAHPARLAIIEALSDGEEKTATDCASLTGLSASATAYHLKVLERWGIVEPATPRPDGRERPWRARGRGIEVRTLRPGTITAEMVLLDVALDRVRQLLRDFIVVQGSETEEWRDVTELGSNDLWLTVEEVRDLSRAFRDLVEPYRRRDREARVPGSRRVRVARLIVPRVESPPS